MQGIADTLHALAQQVDDVLAQLDDAAYSTPTALLGHSSIGQHVRHSLEILDALLKGYENGQVNYENRQRYQPWQSEVHSARQALKTCLQHIGQPDKPMQVEVRYHHSESTYLHTTYWRELVYNTEHLIHHMALIRIQLACWPQVQVHPHFGVAPSTIQYREQCAQ